jgi:hypothetical protein
MKPALLTQRTLSASPINPPIRAQRSLHLSRRRLTLFVISLQRKDLSAFGTKRTRHERRRIAGVPFSPPCDTAHQLPAGLLLAKTRALPRRMRSEIRS